MGGERTKGRGPFYCQGNASKEESGEVRTSEYFPSLLGGGRCGQFHYYLVLEAPILPHF
jgi:hypothetical protein